MDVLVFGGTRFVGVHLVRALLMQGHAVTLATRGKTPDAFGAGVERIGLDRTDGQSIRAAFKHRTFDVVYDSLAYSSNDVKTLFGAWRGMGRYIMTSTAAVYRQGPRLRENTFAPCRHPFCWCSRGGLSYAETKRQAECALFGEYKDIPAAAVRFPVVLGADDYTRRMAFYVEHIVRGKAMEIDNLEDEMCYVRSDEAGEFLALLAREAFTGPINAASAGTICIKELARYVHGKTGREMVLSPSGDAAPYNGMRAYSLDTAAAQSLGAYFSPLESWFWKLADFYIG